MAIIQQQQQQIQFILSINGNIGYKDRQRAIYMTVQNLKIVLNSNVKTF